MKHICELCKLEKPLCESHIIPSFVYAWIKETSATGYLRQASAINRRLQDGYKIKLLCGECEELFSKWEKLFAKKIFRPFVKIELDKNGVAQSKIESFDYEEWLLKFIISVQWRVMQTEYFNNENIKNEPFYIRIPGKSEEMRKYLLAESDNTGKNETHMLFLQSLSSAIGSIPTDVPDDIDSYLLRTIDATFLSSGNKWGFFSKIGPIAFITTMDNWTLKHMPNTRIRLRGQMKTMQWINDPIIGRFIVADRPKEVKALINYSDKQKEKISDTLKNNPERYSNSMSQAIQNNRSIIKKKKEK